MRAPLLMATSLVLGLGYAAAPAQAWVLTVTAGTRAVYLCVGACTANGSNTTVNLVSLSVPAAQLGNSTAQAMTSNSAQANSPYDNYTVCTPPAQVYVGGFYRVPTTNTTVARLQVTSPANLTNGTNTLGFTNISWTSTAIGNTATDIPAGTFNGGTLALATFAANTFVENCHTFRYANTQVPAAGTYTGRVTYTLTTP